jgi:hypothetical protein
MRVLQFYSQFLGRVCHSPVHNKYYQHKCFAILVPIQADIPLQRTSFWPWGACAKGLNHCGRDCPQLKTSLQGLRQVYDIGATTAKLLPTLKQLSELEDTAERTSNVDRIALEHFLTTATKVARNRDVGTLLFSRTRHEVWGSKILRQTSQARSCVFQVYGPACSVGFVSMSERRDFRPGAMHKPQPSAC